MLTTDCNLYEAPRRRTDGAIIIDTAKWSHRLYAGYGGVVYLKRKDGSIEKQYRYTVEGLPVGYQTEPDGQFVYILDDAVTTDVHGHHHVGDEHETPPVPPCIVYDAKHDRTHIRITLDDVGSTPGVVRVSADSVGVQLQESGEPVEERLLGYLRDVLKVPLGQLELEHMEEGRGARDKVVYVHRVDAPTVFHALYRQYKQLKGHA